MATIRQIVPSQAISDFRPVRQEGGAGFRALAGAMDVAYTMLMPEALAEAERIGTPLGDEILRSQVGNPGSAVVQSTMGGAPAQAAPADPNAVLAGDAMAALGKGGGHDHASHAGQSHEEWLRYSNQGATRNDPLNPKLVDAMSFLGGMGITMDVTSGGQEAAGEGGSRTGSTRHDHGNAADVDFYKDGRKLVPSNPDDAVILKQIVQTAKSRGVTGFGEGDDYMGAGRVHIGFGAPGVWGAGGQGANAPAWLREAYDGVPQGTYAGQPGPTNVSASTMDGGAPAPGYEPPTVMRGADGKLTARLFGPTSNPIMAAHDAAAGVAYQSGLFLKAGQDFMAMSQQFALNPEGFQQAADGYVKAMVENAPEQFRMDVRANLEKEANRRFLGLVDEKHTDIRNRANNSSAALADMWADDLAGAIATGNPEEIEAARTELASVLSARERLPGLSWTPEQSANYMRKAEEAGMAAVKKAQDEQGSKWKDALNVVIDSAKTGRRAADEAILDNPTVQAMFPELWREAAAFTTLRDELPTFNTMTPAEQQAALAEMKAQPVTEEWENDLYGAAEKAAAANAKAWRADPIARAGEVLTTNPPPVLPELDPNDPQAFITALGARAEYGNGLVEAGYTDRAVFVSKDEAKALGAMFGKDVPPEMKAMAAGAIVGAMGPDAAGFFKQINTTDPVIPHVGGLMAMGGDPSVATEAMAGQSLLDQKAVQAPTASAIAKGMSGVHAAIAATPGALGAMGAIRDTATAIYAARIPAGADEAMQAQVMEEAFQAALGQSNSLGRTVGGVQTIGENQVLLPPNMAGEDLQGALDAAFGTEAASTGFWSRVSSVGRVSGAQEPRMDMFAAAAGGIPALGGEPIDPGLWASGEIVMTPVGGTRYMLSVNRNGVTIDIGVQGQPDNVPFIFDAELLIEASLVPK